MKTLALEYTGYKLDYRINLGDEIQTIAASRLLHNVDGYVSREALNTVNEPCIVSLNGFFMDSENWPPSSNVVPIPFAFHISQKYEKNICSPEGLQYLKRHAPIGCRDRGTLKILQKHGIDAFYSINTPAIRFGVGQRVLIVLPGCVVEKKLLCRRLWEWKGNSRHRSQL